MPTHESESYEAGKDIMRELVAEWMIAHGFSTGHGDTMLDLLNELSWQIAELRSKNIG